MAAFFMVFVLCVIQIIMRYGTFGKVGKYFELCQIAFIWCSVLSASYGGRAGTHVEFSILYNKVSPTSQIILRIIGNVVVIAAFIIIMPYAWEAIDFLKIKKSDLLRIPFNWIYMPFMSFIGLSTIHCLTSLVKDIISIYKKHGRGKPHECCYFHCLRHFGCLLPH